MKLAFQLLVFYGSLITLTLLSSGFFNFDKSIEKVEQEEHRQLDKSIIEHLQDKHQIYIALD